MLLSTCPPEYVQEPKFVIQRGLKIMRYKSLIKILKMGVIKNRTTTLRPSLFYSIFLLILPNQ